MRVRRVGRLRGHHGAGTRRSAGNSTTNERCLDVRRSIRVVPSGSRVGPCHPRKRNQCSGPTPWVSRKSATTGARRCPGRSRTRRGVSPWPGRLRASTRCVRARTGSTHRQLVALCSWPCSSNNGPPDPASRYCSVTPSTETDGPERLGARSRWAGGECGCNGRGFVRRGRLGASSVPTTYELFSSTERLGRMAMERMLAGLSTWRYPVGVGAGRAAHRQTATPACWRPTAAAASRCSPAMSNHAVTAFANTTVPAGPVRVIPCRRPSSRARVRQVWPGEPDHQQREPAEQDVGADAGLEPMQHRAQLDGRLHIAEAAFGLEQVPVAERDVLGRQVRIRGGQQLLAVQLRLSGDLARSTTSRPDRVWRSQPRENARPARTRP